MMQRVSKKNGSMKGETLNLEKKFTPIFSFKRFCHNSSPKFLFHKKKFAAYPQEDFLFTNLYGDY
jgi:hypothetical protein